MSPDGPPLREQTNGTPHVPSRVTDTCYASRYTLDVSSSVMRESTVQLDDRAVPTPRQRYIRIRHALPTVLLL